MKKFIIKFKLYSIKEVEQIILLFNLGILFALKNDIITPFLAEVIFYTPYLKKILKKIGIRKKIIEYLIHEGWEMDALNSLDKYLYYKTIDEKIDYTCKLLKLLNNSGNQNNKISK